MPSTILKEAEKNKESELKQFNLMVLENINIFKVTLLTEMRQQVITFINQFPFFSFLIEIFFSYPIHVKMSCTRFTSQFSLAVFGFGLIHSPTMVAIALALIILHRSPVSVRFFLRFCRILQSWTPCAAHLYVIYIS